MRQIHLVAIAAAAALALALTPAAFAKGGGGGGGGGFGGGGMAGPGVNGCGRGFCTVCGRLSSRPITFDLPRVIASPPLGCAAMLRRQIIADEGRACETST